MNEMTHVRARQTADALIGSLRARLSSVLADAIPPGPLALVDFPDHPNVGDSAIWLGETAWLRDAGRMPDYTSALADFSAEDLAQAVPEGPILIHGGGNFGTTWIKHEELRMHLLRSFPGRPIVQLPQSIHYGNEGAVREMARAVAAHGAFTLLTRDMASFEFAKRNFDCEVHLCPDSALYLGRQKRLPPSVELLALLRTDHERVEDASAMPDRVACTDWLHEDRLERTRLRALVKLGTLLAGSEQDKRLRRYQALAGRRVQRGLAVLSRGRFVITDRLHAHILCLLLDIPHVALNNSYGKVSGFAEQWTADYEGFYQARSRAEAFELALEQIGLQSSSP